MTAVEVTTVADDLVVLHDADEAFRFDGLEPDTRYELLGQTVRTLARPGGELLSTIATVNDVHFGETEAGQLDGRTEGLRLRSEPGEAPYPETMNRAAASEIATLDPAMVFVKGDLSLDGQPDEWAAFEACYRLPFGERLAVVAGNHDTYHGQDRYTGDQWFDLPGLTIGLLDTTIPTRTTGGLTSSQLADIDDRLASVDRPVLLLGHHQQWVPKRADMPRSDDYFGLHPDASDALDAICARHRSVIGYAAGHTHRHRVRRMAISGVLSIEVGCVKDFPGTWAEYRVYEGGVMQVVHRVSEPAALRWSNRCRHLYEDYGVDYEAYARGALAERCFVFPPRN